MAVQLKSLGKHHKTAILFLHGGPGMDDSYFFPHITKLAEEFSLHTYMQGGGGVLTIAGLVAEVETVVKTLADKNLFILGHSFGSCLLLEYVKRQKILPAHVKGLILCTWYYDRAFLKPYMQKTVAYTKKHGITLSDGLPQSNEELRQNSLDLVGLYFSDEFIDEGKKVFAAGECNVRLYRNLHHNYLKNVDHRKTLAQITLPILSIAAQKDCIFAIDYVRKGLDLNKHIQHAEMDTGHFPFVEKPQAFNALVTDFLKKSLKE